MMALGDSSVTRPFVIEMEWQGMPELGYLWWPWGIAGCVVEATKRVGLLHSPWPAGPEGGRIWYPIAAYRARTWWIPLIQNSFPCMATMMEMQRSQIRPTTVETSRLLQP